MSVDIVFTRVQYAIVLIEKENEMTAATVLLLLVVLVLVSK